MSDLPRCAMCGRVLKDPAAIRDGMGRKCREKHQRYVEKFFISLFPEPEKKTRRQHNGGKRSVAQTIHGDNKGPEAPAPSCQYPLGMDHYHVHGESVACSGSALA